MYIPEKAEIKNIFQYIVVMLILGTIFLAIYSSIVASATGENLNLAGTQCSGPEPPLITNLNVYKTPSLQEPLPRTYFRDPVFGRCLVRVTDRKNNTRPPDSSGGLKNEYSRVQSFNADETKILIRSTAAYWYLYDAKTLKWLSQLPFQGAVDPRWDATNPNLLYYINEGNTSLMSINISSGKISRLHDFAADFPGKPLYEVWTRYEGSPSIDGRYWGLMAEDLNYNITAFVVYDQVLNKVTAIRNLVENYSIDSVTISPLGDYFLAQFDYCPRDSPVGNDSHPCGLMVYDHNLKNGRSLVRNIGHDDLALDAQGREVLVFQDNDNDTIAMLDLASGTETPLWSINFSNGNDLGFHFSGRAFRLPGWALVSVDGGKEYTWMDNQIFAVELKKGGHVVRLAHHHSVVNAAQEKDYWAETQANTNRNLTRALFTSNWGRSGTDEVDTYMIQLPPNWDKEVGNNQPNAPSTPSGTTSGKPGTSYSYSTSATDPDGDQVKYTFDWGDGTNNVTGLVNSGSSASLPHKWTKSGTFQVKSMATDSKGATSGWSSSLAVIMNNPPNTPSVPSGLSSGYAFVPYSYSTSATDPDGDQVKYTFDWGDGTNNVTGLVNSGSSASLPHKWTKSGIFQVKSMATDSKGATSGWSTSLAVAIATNSPPNAPSTPSGTTSGKLGTSYSYSTSATDPDGDQVKYTFDWGDGTNNVTGLVNSGSSASLPHKWTKSGIFQVKSMATDSKGATSGWSTSLAVAIATNSPPNAPSTPSGTTSGKPGTSYSYSTSATDPDGDQVKYTFDWGDGTNNVTGLVNSGSSASLPHKWTKSGTFQVKSMATDSKGATSGWSSSLAVIMNNPPNTPSVPSGLSSGYAFVPYSYSTSATDPDGDQVKYTFDWGDGTNNVTGLVNSGSSASLPHKWTKSGIFQVKSMATDSKGATSGWSTSLAVAIATNSPPNAPSTPSGTTSGKLGTSYSYSTSATDPDGDQVKYTFDWGDGTNNVTGLVNSGSSASLPHKWTKSGIFQVKSMATDSKGATSGWSTSLAVAIATNSPPNAPSTPSGTTSGKPGTSYSYSTSATDPDGDQVKYTFDWGDGTNNVTGLVNSGSSASLPHKWTKSGTFQVKSMATDSKSATSGWSSSLAVIMNNPPNTPSVPSGLSSGYAFVPYSYSTSATDPDGDQVKYTFDWGDGTNNVTGLVNSGSSASLPHKWTKSGTFQVKSIAIDSRGAQSAISSALTVTIATNNPPGVPSNILGPASGATGIAYGYSTSAIDPDGDQVKHTFDWGDGTNNVTGLVNSSACASLSHKWTKSGTFQVKSMATDSKGATSGWSSSLAVIMNNPPNTPSVPSGLSSGYAFVPYSYSTSATDPDGDQVKYTFDWGDGTNNVTGLVNSGSSASLPHKWTKSGIFQVKSMATDSKGATSGWSTSLAVAIATNSPPNAPSTPSGTTSGKPGTSYSYSTSATDPDGDQVKYTFDWGDGTTTVTGLFNSGSCAGESHKWSKAGTYLIKAKATDSKGSDSTSWSASLSVKIT